MIQLHEDYLYVETGTGETIPCSAELLAVELIGDSASGLDPEIVRHAAAAVLHYFKNDLGKSHVTVQDFSLALERVLRSFGLSIAGEHGPTLNSVQMSDLDRLVVGTGDAFELAFFNQLRDEVRKQLEASPQVLHFRGLRICVKKLLGAKRWSHRCQELSDQIVEFIRGCLMIDTTAASCGLVVR